MGELKIERAVPMCDIVRRSAGVADAVRQLMAADVGDSVFFPTKSQGLSAHSMAIAVGGKGWTASRKEGDGRRIWKIAEPSK